MAQITLPHILTNGTVADATQVMANFQAIVDVVNGNLGSDNLASLSGADVTCIDINGGTTTLNNFTSRFQAGWIKFDELKPKEKRSLRVRFPKAFPDRPIVFVSINDPAPQLFSVGANNVTASQFDFVAYNSYPSDSLTAWGYWLAIYIGAGAPYSGG